MKISNTFLRVITGAGIFAVLALAYLLEVTLPGLHAMRWLSVLAVAGGIVELVMCLQKTSVENFQKNAIPFIVFLGWLVFMLDTAYVVGGFPWLMLWLLMIVIGADIGGWFFGMIFGGDKMWENVSAHKTWSGQIGGIVCGTLMSVLYCKIAGTNVANAIWVGISVSLLSQYGDLTASFIKRRLQIKDFSNLLPGHGGILDRIDGWIYVLPLVWFVLK